MVDTDELGDWHVTIDAATALSIVEAAHSAWNAGDIEGTLDRYVDDLVFITNTGPDGGQMIIRGKSNLREYINVIMQVVEAKTFIESLHFDGEVARIRFNTYVRHRTTGHEMTGTYRELCTFRGSEISQIEDFHDAPRMAAFWRLIGMAETEAVR